MNETKPYNILIAGVGGQGVFTLSRVISILCQRHNLPVNGTTYKGGAQRLGSVYSTIRIFQKDFQDAAFYSSQIGNKDLDLMIGLEPWETIRYKHLFHSQTKVFFNEDVSPLFVERTLKNPIQDPVEILKQMGLPVFCKDYSQQALSEFGDKKMCNYLMLDDVIKEQLLPFTREEFVEVFMQNVAVKNENFK